MPDYAAPPNRNRRRRAFRAGGGPHRGAGGQDSVVYERHADVAGRFHGDFQGIENYSTRGDALEELAAAGVDPTFKFTPFSEAVLYDDRGREWRYRASRAPLLHDSPRDRLRHARRGSQATGDLGRGAKSGSIPRFGHEPSERPTHPGDRPSPVLRHRGGIHLQDHAARPGAGGALRPAGSQGLRLPGDQRWRRNRGLLSLHRPRNYRSTWMRRSPFLPIGPGWSWKTRTGSVEPARSGWSERPSGAGSW